MKNRRKVIFALGAGVLAVPFDLFAQQQGNPVRVGIINTASAESTPRA
jgi:hypothetical protein